MGEQKEKRCSLGPTHAAARGLRELLQARAERSSSTFLIAGGQPRDALRVFLPNKLLTKPVDKDCSRAGWYTERPGLLTEVRIPRIKTAQSSVTIIMTSHAP